MQNTSQQTFDEATHAWRNRVIEVLAKIEGTTADKIALPNKPDDLLRMLNWKSWSVRYQVNLEFILRELLTYFESKRKRQRNVVTLGLSLTALTGPGARSIISDAIKREYPNGENVQMARSAFQNRMVDITKPMQLPPALDLDRQVDEYRKRMAQRHARLAEAQETFKRRPWRNNPWL